ncbi:hypothetical protein B0H13DRAFT_2369766 [Mycena leptocephala]|nr:hypothetical protein B0H13DRAFT_2369766 [Mycena leptocephala]
MTRGRPALEPEVKAERRKETLRRYAAKNRDSLRLAARERMKLLRARSTEEMTEGETSNARLRARVSAAKYREAHRDKIRAGDALRRAESYLTTHGAEAFDEKQNRPHMVKTQKRHEGGRRCVSFVKFRSTTRWPRLPQTPTKPPRGLTPNQKRCRALRRSGFEEDNGEDSDADLPPGMCGCDLTECQRTHKNETKDRKDWKIFHLKYAHEL